MRENDLNNVKKGIPLESEVYCCGGLDGGEVCLFSLSSNADILYEKNICPG